MSILDYAPTALPHIEGRHPQSCCWCRQAEPNDFLMGNNHYPGMGLRVGMCIAQQLTRNHVRYSTDRLTLGARDRHGNRRPMTGEAKEWERGHLAKHIDRAAMLWGHRDDAAFIDEARAVLAATVPLVVPEHAAVAASEEVSLW